MRKGCCPLVPLPSENGKVRGRLTSDTSRGRIGYICPNCQAPAATAGRKNHGTGNGGILAGLWQGSETLRCYPEVRSSWRVGPASGASSSLSIVFPSSPELGTGCRSQPCPAAWSHPSQHRMDLFVAKGSCSYHGSDAVGCCGADGVMVGIGGCIDSAITREEQGGEGAGEGQLKQAAAGQASPKAPPSPMRPSQLPVLAFCLEESFWNLVVYPSLLGGQCVLLGDAGRGWCRSCESASSKS